MLKKFVIIDGNAIIHRAYHALPPLTRPDGQVVNAVYGFFFQVVDVFGDYKPDYLGVCFYRSKPTFRQSMYAGYHAHRPQMANDLSPQFPMIIELLENVGAQIFALDGYEGDDMIGT